jgi:hypothetical protein
MKKLIVVLGLFTAIVSGSCNKNNYKSQTSYLDNSKNDHTKAQNRKDKERAEDFATPRDRAYGGWDYNRY